MTAQTEMTSNEQFRPSHVLLTQPVKHSTTMKKLMTLAAALVFTVGVTIAQDTKQNAKATARQAGQTVDAAADKAGRETKQAGRKVANAAENTADDVKDGTKRAGQKVSKAAKNTKEDIKDGTNQSLNKADRKMKKAERKLDNSK